MKCQKKLGINMSLKLYNTLSRKEEDFIPLDPPKVGMYICGPTVYDYDHIGHMRTYTNSDILIRVLECNGFTPKVVMNITDVGHLTSDADVGEDKLEKGARREGKTVQEIAQFYTDHFFSSCRKLNIKKPQVICKATDHIKQMIDLVKKLEEKGFTYIIPSDGVYFDTSKLKDYGKLAKLDVEGLKPGARIKAADKRNPTDFALLKFAKKGEKRQQEWDSPWGKHSFPGWHIECSAMSMYYLGNTLDIHTGGVEHIPVHHTNEIAQSEAVTGKLFVKYWFHSEHLMIEGQKMSKSLGNLLKVEDIEKKGFNPLALRYLFLTAHYRGRMNFTWEALKGAQQALDRLYSHLKDFRQEKERTVLSEKKMKKIDQFKVEFIRAINNDLDISETISLVWKVVKSNIPNYDKYDLLVEWDQVLGLDLTKSKVKSQKSKVDEEIKKLVDKREELRKQKKWEEADEIRKELEKKGFVVEDTSEGPQLKVKREI